MTLFSFQCGQNC